MTFRFGQIVALEVQRGLLAHAVAAFVHDPISARFREKRYFFFSFESSAPLRRDVG